MIDVTAFAFAHTPRNSQLHQRSAYFLLADCDADSVWEAANEI